MLKSITTNQDWCSYTVVYLVKATSREDAFNQVMEHGYYPEGKRIYSDYDCTGQHFCGRIYMSDVKWSHSRKCYTIEHRWGIDI